MIKPDNLTIDERIVKTTVEDCKEQLGLTLTETQVRNIMKVYFNYVREILADPMNNLDGIRIPYLGKFVRSVKVIFNVINSQEKLHETYKTYNLALSNKNKKITNILFSTGVLNRFKLVTSEMLKLNLIKPEHTPRLDKVNNYTSAKAFFDTYVSRKVDKIYYDIIFLNIQDRIENEFDDLLHEYSKRELPKYTPGVKTRHMVRNYTKGIVKPLFKEEPKEELKEKSN